MIDSLLGHELTRVATVSILGASLLSLAALSGTGWMRRSPELLHRVLLASLVLVLMLPALSLIVPAWSLSPDPIRFDPAAGLSAKVIDFEPAVFDRSLHRAPGNAPVYRSPASWLAALWFSGLLVMAVRYCNDLRARQRILRDSVTCPPELSIRCAVIRGRLGIRRTIRLRLHGEVSVPMTWSLIRPVIMLPAPAVSWAPERMQIVLMHELAHVARLDALARSLADLVSIIHWFNPLVHGLAHRLRQTAELATDRVVVSKGASLEAYIGTLVDMARSSRPLRLSHAAVRSSELERRVTALVERDSASNAWIARCHASALALWCTTLVMAAGVGRAEQGQAETNVYDMRRGAATPIRVALLRLPSEPEAEFGPRLHRMLDSGATAESVLRASRHLRTDAERQHLLERLLDSEPSLLPSVVGELHRLRADAALQELIIAICQKGRLPPRLVTELVNQTTRLRSVAAREAAIVAVADTQLLGAGDRGRLRALAGGLRPESRQRALFSLR